MLRSVALTRQGTRRPGTRCRSVADPLVPHGARRSTPEPHPFPPGRASILGDSEETRRAIPSAAGFWQVSHFARIDLEGPDRFQRLWLPCCTIPRSVFDETLTHPGLPTRSRRALM
ncbi:hypothetical protein CDEST_10950 [Colletotrichum destructivum]|uniref:Uncharacterized protein n=1 Tax=Colletotrichum destructivum TaxID=34406 RepID=A0AAX4IRS0_9PEZI|nr:hypothetical protein CDEST_10950 [Colletotrichum destructivum]